MGRAKGGIVVEEEWVLGKENSNSERTKKFQQVAHDHVRGRISIIRARPIVRQGCTVSQPASRADGLIIAAAVSTV